MKRTLLLIAIAVVLFTINQLPLQARVQQTRVEGCVDYFGIRARLRIQNLSIFGSNWSEYGSVSEAQAALRRILDFTGLAANFDIRPYNVPNAAAVIHEQQRFILYNPQFMSEVRNRVNTGPGTDWAASSILAHEIGHHLQGHTLLRSGNPGLELQADYFSGFVLQRMGASLAQAQAAMNAIGSPNGSSTHPPRAARVSEIAKGWNASANLQNPSPASGVTPQSGVFYYIQSNVSGLNLDVYGASRDNGGDVVQAKAEPRQVWKLIPSESHPGYFYIQSNVSGLYLDVYGGSKGNGANVVQANRDPNQVWKYIPSANHPGYFHIQSKVSDLYLDVYGGSRDNGANVVQANKDPNQVWRFVPLN